MKALSEQLRAKDSENSSEEIQATYIDLGKKKKNPWTDLYVHNQFSSSPVFLPAGIP